MDKFIKILIAIGVIVFLVIALLKFIYKDEIKAFNEQAVENTLNMTEGVVNKAIDKTEEQVKKSLEEADKKVSEAINNAKEELENK